eukprot:12665593-Alexandrium_andersonii.AAC.1
MAIMDCARAFTEIASPADGLASASAVLAGAEWLGPDPRASIALASPRGRARAPEGSPGPEESEL